MMCKPFNALVLIALFTSFSLPAHGGESGNSSTPHWQIGARNVDGGSRAYGEVTEQVPQEGAPEPGGPPSQEHPTVSASDPSMWDEQPHQVCVSDGGRIPDMDCMADKILHPSRPQEDAPAAGGGGPRVITITTRQAATLIASGSGITRQPPGPKVIISMAFIVYTNPTRYLVGGPWW